MSFPVSVLVLQPVPIPVSISLVSPVSAVSLVSPVIAPAPVPPVPLPAPVVTLLTTLTLRMFPILPTLPTATATPRSLVLPAPISILWFPIVLLDRLLHLLGRGHAVHAHHLAPHDRHDLLVLVDVVEQVLAHVLDIFLVQAVDVAVDTLE